VTRPGALGRRRRGAGRASGTAADGRYPTVFGGSAAASCAASVWRRCWGRTGP